MWKLSGPWTNLLASLDLHAMLRDTLAALDQLPEACAGSAPASPAVLIPPWPNWKSPFAVVWTQQRLTAWCLVALPKTVKHP